MGAHFLQVVWIYSFLGTTGSFCYQNVCCRNLTRIFSVSLLPDKKFCHIDLWISCHRNYILEKTINTTIHDTRVKRQMTHGDVVVHSVWYRDTVTEVYLNNHVDTLYVWSAACGITTYHSYQNRFIVWFSHFAEEHVLHSLLTKIHRATTACIPSLLDIFPHTTTTTE